MTDEKNSGADKIVGSSDVLGVTEYRDRTEIAMNIVEMDAQDDVIGRSAHCLRLEVLRLRGIIDGSRTLINGEAVRIPTSESEAVLMVNLGTQYLRDNAPHRLAEPNVELTGSGRPYCPESSEQSE